MLGTDHDDALKAVTKALFSGVSPYSVHTYLNPGASVGPGMVILLAPFVLLNVYQLITPSLTAILAYLVFRTTNSLKVVNLFLLLLMSSPAFWELMTNGSDLIAFGILCTIPLLLWQKHLSIYTKGLIFIFIAMTLTSRIIFIYLAPVFALLFCERKIDVWLKYVTVLGTIAISIHLIFYTIDPTRYTPLLLLDKGLDLINLKIIFIVTVVAVIVWYYSFRFTVSRQNMVLVLWIWTALPLLMVTLMSFNYDYKILYQYPFSYFAPQLPIIVTYVVLHTTKTSEPCPQKSLVF
jgi:hypothetical protein